jgi:hypothetical protein
VQIAELPNPSNPVMVEMVTEEIQEQVKQNKEIIIKNRTLGNRTPLYIKSVSLFFIG